MDSNLINLCPASSHSKKKFFISGKFSFFKSAKRIKSSQEEGKAVSRRLLRYTPDTHICSADFQLRFEQKDVSYVRAEMDESGIICYYQSAEVLADKPLKSTLLLSGALNTRRAG